MLIFHTCAFLTLTWLCDLDVRTLSRYSKNVPAYQKLRSQDFQKLEYEQDQRTDRQTDKTERINTATSVVGNLRTKKKNQPGNGMGKWFKHTVLAVTRVQESYGRNN